MPTHTPYTLSSWTPNSFPSVTSLSSVPTDQAGALLATLTSILEQATTEANLDRLVTLASLARGAEASLTIISAEAVLATATDPQVQSAATQAWFDATLNLVDLQTPFNYYHTNLKAAPNYVYLVVFGITFLYTVGMCWKSRYHWYNIAFFAGLGLEFAGFLGRVLSIKDTSFLTYYLLQYISLTIAPAFLMGGIYFLFAQIIVIHGRQYSYLKPMWYSYFFIATDCVSLFVQAGGGGAASLASKTGADPKPGTDTMIAGISFQVIAMTVFLYFWIDCLFRLYFKHNQQTEIQLKKTPANFFRMLFNFKSIREYRFQLESNYNPQFASVRARKLVPYFPLAMSISVLAIYIRCVYRVVELAQGFSGYLVTHEVYLMVLDALMIAIVAIVFVPFHPLVVFGSENVVRLATIKNNADEEGREKINDVNVDDESESIAGSIRESREVGKESV